MITLVIMLAAAQGTRAPVVDGRIDAVEWAGATRQAMVNGGELYLLRQADYLYVGIRGPHLGLASLCIVSAGRVRILHASAAVGEALYEYDGAAWVRRDDFTWALRDSPGGAGPGAADRTAFLEKTGWLANASASGSPEREFQIRIADVDAIAVTFLSTGDPLSVSYWPDTTDDDCRDVRVPRGYLPVTARFRPERWYTTERK